MVRQVEIGGAVRPVSFGMNCLASFSKETGIGFSDMVTEIPMYARLAIIYYALIDGARIEKKDFNHTQEEVGDWIGTDIDLLNKLIRMFIEDWVPESKNVVSPASKAKKS